MKKKILIVIVAVAMMIPLLSVGASAAFNFPDFSNRELKQYPLWGQIVDTRGGDFVFDYSYVYIIDMKGLNNYFQSLDLSYTSSVDNVTTYLNLSSGGDFLLDSNLNVDASGQQVREFYLGYANDPITVCRNSSGSYGLRFRHYFVPGQLNYTTRYSATYSYTYIFSKQEIPSWGITEFVDQYGTGAWDFVTSIELTEPKNALLFTVELMFDNFSRIIGGLAAGVTGAFTALIWENPEATEKTLSTAAKFIFTIAGLSIGMTVFYLVLRLIRFGRQR